jgi:small conductance mechanosensitive channel
MEQLARCPSIYSPIIVYPGLATRPGPVGSLSIIHEEEAMTSFSHILSEHLQEPVLSFSRFSVDLIELGKRVGMTILGALALWILGSWLIRIAVRLTERAMNNQKVDKTVVGYVGSTMTITLKILLVVGILGFFGIQTTTFAALIAALGLAIGVAWSGLLANFAAGAFLVILRPFKTGDIISAGGITGTVEEIGLFSTTINTEDGVRTFVGNNKIFSDNIMNYSANPYRQITCTIQLDHTTDHNAAMRLLKERIYKIPNVLPKPEAEIGIARFTPLGPVLVVKPCCDYAHHTQVQYDTNRVIRETFSEAGFQVPKQHNVMKN